MEIYMRKYTALFCCLFLLTLLAQVGYAQSQEVKNIHAGFRGVPWGITASEAKSYGLSNIIDGIGGVKYCIRENENLSLGDVQLSYIQYHFVRGKFYEVEIVSVPRTEAGLYAECLKLFGEKSVDFSYRGEPGKYEWYLSDVTVTGYFTSIGSREHERIVIIKNDRPQHTGGGL